MLATSHSCITLSLTAEILSLEARSSDEFDRLGGIEGLARAEDRPRPRPRQHLARGGNQSQLLGLAAVDEPLGEGVGRVCSAQGAECPQVQARPQKAIALARNEGAVVHTGGAHWWCTLVPLSWGWGAGGLGQRTRPSPWPYLARQRVRAFARHEQWKHHAAAHARHGAQALLDGLQRGVPLHLLSDGPLEIVSTPDQK